MYGVTKHVPKNSINDGKNCIKSHQEVGSTKRIRNRHQSATSFHVYLRFPYRNSVDLGCFDLFDYMLYLILQL